MRPKGFALLLTMFLLLFLAVAAVILNRQAGLGGRLARHVTEAMQVQFGLQAALESAVWRLTADPYWRTGTSDTNFAWGTVTYARTVTSARTLVPSLPAEYDDAVTIVCRAPEAMRVLSTTLRFYLLTAAGSGARGSSGDGGPAISASLKRPEGVAADTNGNVYIADTDNHRVRKISPSGIITTVAGSGNPGSFGNGWPATWARLNNPSGVAVHSSGDLYIADTDNHWVRRVDATTGYISLAAGDEFWSSPVSGSGSNQLSSPAGVFVDASRNLFIADTGNHRIQRRSASGTYSTVAGTGTSGYNGDGIPATTASLNQPSGVFVNTDGSVLIADLGNHRVRLVSAAGLISTVVGTGTAGYSGDGGAATAAQMDGPRDVARDAAGNLYVTDNARSCVRIVNHNNGIVDTLAGTGAAGHSGDRLPASTAQLNQPNGLALFPVRGGARIYVADRENDRIRLLLLRPDPLPY